MMKLTTKFLVAGAIGAFAIALSIAPSEAAKKKAMAKSCGNLAGLCSTNCSNGFCSVFTCGGDGQWYPAVLTPICPQATCVNVKKKC